MTVYSPQETAMAALFELVKKSAGYKTTGRKMVLWGETSKEMRPCLYMHEMDNDVQGGKTGVPQVVDLKVNLFIYTWAKESTNPAGLINPLIDAVFYALRPSPMTGKNNLGLPFVDHAWISGKLFKDPGDLDGDGLAIIPVTVRMPVPLVYQALAAS